jgi:hypothetical protein
VTLPTPQEAERMTGAQVIEVLRKVLDEERAECARLADGMAERLVRSGKHDHATVALQIGAQIRARGK